MAGRCYGEAGTFEKSARPTNSALSLKRWRIQAQADTICAFARSTMLHYGYEGAGPPPATWPSPTAPAISAGEVYVFSVYHLMDVEDLPPFSINTFSFRGGAENQTRRFGRRHPLQKLRALQLTMDIIFNDYEGFEKVRKAKVINEELVCKHNITPQQIVGIVG